MEYLIALLSCWVALIHHRRPWTAGPNGGFPFPMFLILALAAVLVLARLGQGGSRLAALSEASTCTAVQVGDRTEDCHWRLGIFYFNPDDAAVSVEKRVGLGYTLNFARLATWTIVFFFIDGPR